MSSGAPGVLVVEDEKPLADLFEMWLEESFDVRTVTTGRAALDAIGEDLAVVVLDWRMPEVDGVEILAEIRNRDLPCAVVVVTGFEPDFDEVEYHVDAALTKPVSSDQLRSVVEEFADMPIPSDG